MSREQLAAVTKVSARQIEALEAGRFDLLPAPVFTRGFLRAIAHHLGLDADRTVAAYSHVHRLWSAAEEARRPVTGTLSGTDLRRLKARRSLSSDTTVLGLGVAALLALVTGAAAFLKSRGTVKSVSTPAPVATRADRVESGPASLALPPAIAAATVALAPEARPSGIAAPGAETAQGSGASSAAPVLELASVRDAGPAASPGGARTLTLTFRDDCWTEVTVDGKVVAAELFRKGTTRAFQGARRFTLTLGNAGGVEVAVDGRSLASIGTPGEVVRNFVIDDGLPARRPARG